MCSILGVIRGSGPAGRDGPISLIPAARYGAPVDYFMCLYKGPWHLSPASNNSTELIFSGVPNGYDNLTLILLYYCAKK